MSKTQVMKLNTSKDNVQAFFDKIKSKLNQAQSKTHNLQNFDITMIVKHQSKHSFKSQPKPTEQPNTVKSILSENDPNLQGINNKKTKPKILNEDNQVQSRMLGTELSINQSTSQQNVVKSTHDSYASGRKLRQSNKMPSIGSMFRFQKKGETQNVSSSNKKVLQSSEIIQQPEHNVKFEQDQKQKQSQTSEKVSESSKQQQINEQNLKKNVSRKNIDIFPNIQIGPAVSGQLYSMRNFNNLKPFKHKRRCSIADESLLSPKTSKLADQIKQESARNILESVKTKLKQKSMNKLLQQSDCINQVKNTDDEGQSHELKDKQKQSMNQEMVKQLMNLQEDTNQLKPVITTKSTSINNAPKQRQKALVKRSIFDSQNQHRRFQSNITSEAPSSTNRVKTSSHLQIQPHHKSVISPSEQSSASEQQQTSSKSSNQQPDDSVYVIENKLNDCIRLLQKNQLSSLQDYLYEFKDKYFYVSNTRIQIKWRLLMAHCKENKREFERAAINYNNVIDMAKENPKSLTIQPAEVYHRLGVCYSEIGWWNKGILALAQALNRYKKCRNAVKYAQCMNNLGTLYLQASSLSLAEKCFIQSYNLKKSLYGKNNTKLLTSLFNIFQCNLLTKNYDQAQKVINVIEQQIITQIPDSEPNKQLYLGGMYRRKGKMEFLRGNNQQAEKHYLKAFERLASRYPYCMQFGQLMSCLGLLKLEDAKYKEAKQYYDKAIMLMNFYCSKDSVTILTLKKNLEYSIKMIKEQRQGSSSKRSAN